ncbi:MAG: hypothetical protein Q7U97_00190 [Rhodocyclaceae bacterium]|nr:hypothetical protein [Rhodocyclaceae bacterium]
MNLPVTLQAALLLAASNVFMTLIWYTTRNACRVSQNHVQHGQFFRQAHSALALS